MTSTVDFASTLSFDASAEHRRDLRRAAEDYRRAALARSHGHEGDGSVDAPDTPGPRFPRRRRWWVRSHLRPVAA